MLMQEINPPRVKIAGMLDGSSFVQLQQVWYYETSVLFCRSRYLKVPSICLYCFGHFEIGGAYFSINIRNTIIFWLWCELCKVA